MQTESNALYIKAPVACYLEEMVSNFANLSLSPALFPVCEHVLANVFLSMIGAVEQKITHLKWLIGANDISARYKIQQDFSRQTIGEEALKTSYKLFWNSYKRFCGHDYPHKNLWDNDKLLFTAYAQLKNIFTGSFFEMLTGADFASFRMHCPVRYFVLFEKSIIHQRDIVKSAQRKRQMSELQKHLNDTMCNFAEFSGATVQNLSKKKMSDLRSPIFESLYDCVIKSRHKIAHNIGSMRPDKPQFGHNSEANFKYDNYYFKFWVCVYLDLVIREFADSYLSAIQKNFC